MRNITIRDLVLEITRKCNMQCPHCLRGDEYEGCNSSYPCMGTCAGGEKDKRILDQIFQGIQDIGCITLSGGEPTLNVPFIVDLVDYVIEKGIYVGGLYIVTNGKIYSQEMVDAVRKLQHHCMDEMLSNESSYFNKISTADLARQMADERFVSEMIGSFEISVSVDEYHEDIPALSYMKYRTCGLYTTEKEHLEDENNLLIRGRSKENEFDGEDRDPEYLYFEELEEDMTILDTVYVSVDGEVYGDCNLSYEMMEQKDNKLTLSYGNIRETSLYDVLDKAVKKEEKELMAE